MPKILSSIACNLDADILSASLPLLAESRVEAIEWSFDALFNVKDVPPWFLDLIHAFSNEKRLIGHGVFFSLFSGRWSAEQQAWLRHLEKTAAEFHFDHVTEHFGFMTGKDFHHGAPLNVPFSQTTLNIGRDRLKRMYEACQCPVGLENLAFAYTVDEVKRHGEFLEQLIEPVNGFIILDLHNLYCQLHNFSVDFDRVIDLYPLHRVREIHISGGSWDEADADPGRKIRRDTHDDAVPRAVFDLLENTIDRCPNLKYVVLEQLGNGLETEESKRLFYDDFLVMEKIVGLKNLQKNPSNRVESFLPSASLVIGEAAEDEGLYAQQLELSHILETADSYAAATGLLGRSSLAHSDWKIEDWDPSMIETAMKIAQKWRKAE